MEDRVLQHLLNAFEVFRHGDALARFEVEGGITPRSLNVEDFRMADEITLARSHQFNATSTGSLGGVFASCDQQFFCNPLGTRHEIALVHGFEQVVKCPLAQRLHGVFMVGGAKDHEEFSALKPVKEFQARLVGHLDVQKNQVRGALFDHLVRLGALEAVWMTSKLGQFFSICRQIDCRACNSSSTTTHRIFVSELSISFFDLWLKSSDIKNNPQREIYTRSV